MARASADATSKGSSGALRRSNADPGLCQYLGTHLAITVLMVEILGESFLRKAPSSHEVSRQSPRTIHTCRTIYTCTYQVSYFMAYNLGRYLYHKQPHRSVEAHLSHGHWARRIGPKTTRTCNASDREKTPPSSS